MKTYEFTLVLGGVDEATDMLEDKLYEAGCDDALINFRNGTVYLDFDRDAEALEDAIISAIKDVESSLEGATVISVAPDNLVTEADIAKRLDIERQTVSLWIKGERRKEIPFPKPVMKLAEKSPLWKWNEVTSWLYESGIINNEATVEDANFISLVNIALNERDKMVQKARRDLLKKLAA